MIADYLAWCDTLPDHWGMVVAVWSFAGVTMVAPCLGLAALYWLLDRRQRKAYRAQRLALRLRRPWL